MNPDLKIQKGGGDCDKTPVVGPQAWVICRWVIMAKQATGGQILAGWPGRSAWSTFFWWQSLWPFFSSKWKISCNLIFTTCSRNWSEPAVHVMSGSLLSKTNSTCAIVMMLFRSENETFISKIISNKSVTITTDLPEAEELGSPVKPPLSTSNRELHQETPSLKTRASHSESKVQNPSQVAK